MEKFTMSNMVFQRALAKNIVEEVDTALLKNNKNYLKLQDEYFANEKQLNSIKDINRLFEQAKVFEKSSSDVISHLAIKHRLLDLKAKNLDRIKYLDNEIKFQLYQEFDVPQKNLLAVVTEDKETVNENNLNINFNHNGNLKIYFNNSLLSIKNGKLDLNDPNNLEVISHYEEKYLYMIFDKYPDCLSSIPVEI